MNRFESYRSKATNVRLEARAHLKVLRAQRLSRRQKMGAVTAMATDNRAIDPARHLELTNSGDVFDAYEISNDSDLGFVEHAAAATIDEPDQLLQSTEVDGDPLCQPDLVEEGIDPEEAIALAEIDMIPGYDDAGQDFEETNWAKIEAPSPTDLELVAEANAPDDDEETITDVEDPLSEGLLESDAPRDDDAESIGIETAMEVSSENVMTEVPSLDTIPHAGPGLIWMLNQCQIHDLSDLANADAEKLIQDLGVVGQILDVESWVEFARERCAR